MCPMQCPTHAHRNPMSMRSSNATDVRTDARTYGVVPVVVNLKAVDAGRAYESGASQ